MFSKNHSGFTLMEILIALAILGIVVSIAMPSYSNYVKRSKVAEAVVLAEEARLALIANHVKNKVEFAGTGADLGARNVDIGLREHSAYKTDTVQSMWVGGGGVRGAEDTSGHIAIMLEPTLDVGSDRRATRLLSTVEYRDGEYIYICGNTDAVFYSNVDQEYLPASCRN